MTPTLDNITLRAQLELVSRQRADFERTLGERSQQIQQLQSDLAALQTNVLKLQGALEYASSSQQQLIDVIKTVETASAAPATPAS